MHAASPGNAPPAAVRQMLNKVPRVTVYFWIIKVLCTTVGETAADTLNESLKLGLWLTALVMGVLLAAALVAQFRARRYVPAIYWLAVALLSVVGTLITDILTDSLGVPLALTTAVFTVALAATFVAWYRTEGTLSVHAIVTTRREAFYWLAILFTFALGTAAGDLIAEKLGAGYLRSLLLFAGLIVVVAVAHWWLRVNATLAFWAAYVLTRPLGASIGDGLTQDRAAGGLGLGVTGTSAVFLVAIVVLVAYLSHTRRDALDEEAVA